MLHCPNTILPRLDYVHFIRGQEADHFYGKDPIRYLNPMISRACMRSGSTTENAISRLT